MSANSSHASHVCQRLMNNLSADLSIVLILAFGCSTLAQAPLPTDPTGRLNPENLGRACDLKIVRYLESIQTCYSLAPEQRDRVRDRLEQLKQEQIRYSLTMAAERAQLHDQGLVERRELLAQLRQSASQPVDIVALSRQMPSFARREAIKTGEPLFSVENALQEVEELLPAEQAKAGRRRFIEAQGADKREMATQYERELLGVGEGSVLFLRERERGAWASYVHRFGSKFSLSDDQSATAASILRDVEARRDEYLSDHQVELDLLMAFADARAGGPSAYGDVQLQVDRLALFAPVERLWQELRGRLDAVPTVPQVEQARRELPGLPATRPTDYVSGVRPSTTRPASRPT